MSTTLEFALQRAEQVRAVIADLPILSAAPRARLTVSVGVALLPPHGKGVIAILNAADAAMYQAKAEGRNCVRLAQSA
ncbi:MAG: diguanylate cyclase [Chloroflexi bacterium]|nr:diguanylate cyclase [Chloroflexota bacterium]